MPAVASFAPVAVAFDYGNTLVEFGRRHVDHCDAALGRALRLTTIDTSPLTEWAETTMDN